jgi:WD40-like Beta Propeller Repeat
VQRALAFAVRQVVGLVAVSALAASLAVSAHAAFPGANGKIAFDEFGGSGCIYSINPDGSGRAHATPCASPGERSPEWAADGKRLAYYAPNDSIEYVTDGQNPTYLFDSGGSNFGFSWSPDARRIVAAFYVCQGDPQVCTTYLQRASLDGSDYGFVNQRTSDVYMSPAWSPDGTKIAFRGFGGTLYTIAPAGTGMTTLASGVNHPSWSPDGSKIAFDRDGAIWVMNSDGSGQSALTSGSTADLDPAWSPDGTKIAFQSLRDGPPGCGGVGQPPCPYDIFVVNADGTGQTNLTNTLSVSEQRPDWQPIPLNYVRPKAAAPTRVSLVPAYARCSSANRTHGPPLAFPSCNPPAQTSGELTVGTADANGAPAKSIGFVRYGVQVGNPATPADEANVRIIASITDVRNKSDLSDYTGELQLDQGLRITDRDNTPSPGGPGPGTVSDTGFPVTIPCAATGDTTVGSTCQIDTTAEAIVPNAVKEGRRAVWGIGQVKVYDGGSDGDAETTADNTLFMDEGLFVP